MNDGLIISEYGKDDIENLIRLWVEVFGDSEDFVARFFEFLPSVGRGFTAKRGGELLGAAYLLEAELISPDTQPKKLGYIYAVAVKPAARSQGIGARLVRLLTEVSRELGYTAVCTLPSEHSLYSWYESCSALVPVGGIRYTEHQPLSRGLELRRLSAEEYGALRRELLKHKNYVNLNPAWLSLQEELCGLFSGGFYACGKSILCGYVEDGVLNVKELIGDCEGVVEELCFMLGAKRATVRRPAETGEPYIAVFPSESYPPDAFFNLTLD